MSQQSTLAWYREYIEKALVQYGRFKAKVAKSEEYTQCRTTAYADLQKINECVANGGVVFDKHIFKADFQTNSDPLMWVISQPLYTPEFKEAVEQYNGEIVAAEIRYPLARSQSLLKSKIIAEHTESVIYCFALFKDPNDAMLFKLEHA